MGMYYSILENRSVMSLSGEDVEPFLQGIITNDIHKLTADNALYAAILTPQGKYLFDFLLIRRGNEILVDYCTGQKADLLKKLAMYRLRSKVQITETPLSVCALWGGDMPTVPETQTIRKDPRHPQLGYRLIGPQAEIAAFAGTVATEGDYDLHRIDLTIPESNRELLPDKSFPLPSNLEEMHAIDYQKGCYVGQEVTARSKHRGVIRKALYTLRVAEGTPPVPGAKLSLDGQLVGEIFSAKAPLCIAQIEKEAAEKKQPLMAGETKLQIR